MFSRRLIFLFVLLLTTVLTGAQTPVPLPIGQCATVNVEEGVGAAKVADPRRHEFRIPGDIVFVPGNFCSAYTRGGWESTMQLHLGEGAAEYRDLIEQAVRVWNETVNLPEGQPLIEIVDARPTNFSLPTSFWSSTDEVGRGNLDDGQSVIYFIPSGEGERRSWGLAWTSTRQVERVQADVYINTADEQENAGFTLALTTKLVDVDSSYAAYAYHNKTYEVILHELGHAVGLAHLPVNGNVMSRDWLAGGGDQWAATVAFDLFNDFSPRTNDFVKRKSDVHPYVRIPNSYLDLLKRVEFFTKNGKLGAQDKTALTCIYEY